jgi:hypothetical protein
LRQTDVANDENGRTEHLSALAEAQIALAAVALLAQAS